MSKNEIILNALEKSGGWVPMTSLGNFAGCWAVHSRIADLRRKGHQILNRLEVTKDGKKLSYYRLLHGPAEA